MCNDAHKQTNEQILKQNLINCTSVSSAPEETGCWCDSVVFSGGWVSLPSLVFRGGRRPSGSMSRINVDRNLGLYCKHKDLDKTILL